jgi:RND family efflux transporter MFP subunit
MMITIHSPLIIALFLWLSPATAVALQTDETPPLSPTIPVPVFQAPIIETPSFKAPSILIRNVLSEVKVLRRQPLAVELAGNVISPRLPMGQRVSKGEVLLQLDNREATARLKQAQADVTRIEALLAYQLSQLDRAERNFSKGVIARAEHEQLQSQVVQTRAESVRARAQQNIAELIVDKHELRAPFSGVLQQATPHAGERLESGREVTQILDDQQLLASVELPPAEVAALKKQKLLLALPDKPTEALQIKAIAPAAKNNNGMIRLELYLPITAEFIPGQTLYLGLHTQPGVAATHRNSIVSR